jgi:hypothetical protein
MTGNLTCDGVPAIGVPMQLGTESPVESQVITQVDTAQKGLSIHVRFCIRFSERFPAQAGLQFNFQLTFPEMCLQALVMGLHHWQCRDGGTQYKKKTSGKDSVIERQPLQLFM